MPLGRWSAILLLALSGPAVAFTPVLPEGATPTATVEEPLGTARIAIGPYAAGGVPADRREGRVLRQAWRIPGSTAGTLEILSPLRQQMEAAGYHVLFDCAGAECGGFDFRYRIEVLAEPEMHVDLGDFRFLSAERQGPGTAEAVTVLVSRSSEAAYLQIVQVGAGSAMPPSAPVPPAGMPDGAGGAIAALQSAGFVVLEGLDFASGSATLAGGDPPALVELAGWLKADPSRRLVLVGHTDASGGLAGNIALSERRAEAVAARLVALGAQAAQVTAHGVGYLAPRSPNATEAGRLANRRVEAILPVTE